MPDTPTYPNDWARLVDELIKRPGWSKARLATESGINRNTIRRWVKGESVNVSSASVRLIAKAAGIDYDVASRAALGAQEQQRVQDDDAIRIIQESDAPPHVKDELVRHVRSRRLESEDWLRRDIELMLRTRTT